MSQILNKVRDVDANDSEAVKEALSAFFQTLPKFKDIDCIRWLRMLENVINRFPKYCKTHRQTIESYLTHFLFSNNFYNVIEAAKCAHAMQQIKSTQEKVATAKSCWREQMIALCDAAHKLIDARQYGYHETQKDKQAGPISSLQEALSDIDSLGDNPNDAIHKTDILTTRLRNVFVFIQAMLIEIYPVAKPVQPQLIFAVILQALNAPRSEDTTNETIIKIQAMRTLDALVECLGSNLIPFSALLFRFALQTLKWSSENPSEEAMKVRIAAYSSLSRWLEMLHLHRPADGRVRRWHDELTEHIVADVTPAKRVMQLTMNAQPMKNLSKKARKKLANTMLKDSNMALHMPGVKSNIKLSDKANDEVAVAALECAETFLSVSGIFLKNTTHKQLQDLLVRECFGITDHSTERAMRLLHALEACRRNCSGKVPPPTQYCLQLYSVLINSPQREVSKFCSQALLDIRLHLHCSPASLGFSHQEAQTLKRKAKEEGRQRVSERNRAVLEKLLGIDWMNSEDPTDNTITIPDEPAAKRPRAENTATEVIENVSISSDSVHSVEMSSDSDDESIIEGVDLGVQATKNAAVSKPVAEVDAGIHNEPTQINLDGDDTTMDSTSAESTNDNTNDKPAATSLDGDTTQGIKNLAIHDEPTQANTTIEVAGNQNETIKDDAEVEKIMETPPSQVDINEAKTQLPNSDTIDGKSPVSMEVAYDYPNAGNDKVTVLDKMDDENLPLTNDTDDIQITCGQVVKSSQDSGKKDGEIEEDVPKVNGIGATTISSPNSEAKNVDVATNKTAPSDKAVTVEDMLADFVDEVNEEIQV